MELLTIESYVLLAVMLTVLAVKVFALVSALLFPAEAYVAADKLTKPAWGAILGLGVAFQVIGFGGSILTIVFIVAALVYIVDVRPALAGVTRR